MGHKAIETVYVGHRFRSRLEARWAVFFDAMGIQWVYESEGFEHNGVRYLPDFRLPKLYCWVEVKGDPGVMVEEAARLSTMLADGTALPDFEFCGEPNIGGGLILLGDIPRETCLVMHRVIQHTAKQGLRSALGFFVEANKSRPDGAFIVEPASMLAAQHDVTPTAHVERQENFGRWSNEHVALGCCVDLGAAPGYTRARSARFEFGERG